MFTDTMDFDKFLQRRGMELLNMCYVSGLKEFLNEQKGCD